MTLDSARGNETVLLKLWGKLEKDAIEACAYHPALFHMLDVGYVARALLEEGASPRWKNVMAKVFGCDVYSLINWLPWVVALHDIGKISIAFQEQNDLQRKRLMDDGFPLGTRRWQHEPYHSLISQVFLRWEIKQDDFPKKFLQAWRDSVGGHHGRFSSLVSLGEARKRLKQEAGEWKTWRLESMELLKHYLLLLDFRQT